MQYLTGSAYDGKLCWSLLQSSRCNESLMRWMCWQKNLVECINFHLIVLRFSPNCSHINAPSFRQDPVLPWHFHSMYNTPAIDRTWPLLLRVGTTHFNSFFILSWISLIPASVRNLQESSFLRYFAKQVITKFGVSMYMIRFDGIGWSNTRCWLLNGTGHVVKTKRW